MKEAEWRIHFDNNWLWEAKANYSKLPAYSFSSVQEDPSGWADLLSLDWFRQLWSSKLGKFHLSTWRLRRRWRESSPKGPLGRDHGLCSSGKLWHEEDADKPWRWDLLKPWPSCWWQGFAPHSVSKTACSWTSLSLSVLICRIEITLA
jgi:hypothetical protein